MAKIDIHGIWRLTPLMDAETGEVVEVGLFDTIGPAGAARELKKRCDAEIEHAGKPLAGCSMYTQIILHWVGVCLDSSEPGIRAVSETFMKAAGEKEFVDLIEGSWERYKEYDELPEDIKYDIRDEIRSTLEDRYGEISYKPEHLTPKEIELSKTLALGLVRKRRKPTVEPAPEETPEEHEPETEPEPPGKTTVKTEAEMRDEIRANMKRA
jgi:hypothetical protein